MLVDNALDAFLHVYIYECESRHTCIYAYIYIHKYIHSYTRVCVCVNKNKEFLVERDFSLQNKQSQRNLQWIVCIVC